MNEQDFKNPYPPYPSEEKKPHICPVCNGRGIVQRGFYDNSGWGDSITYENPKNCRACGGSGIIIC